MYQFDNFPLDINNQFSDQTYISNIKLSIVIPIRGIERQNSLNVCIWNCLRYGINNVEIVVSEEDSSSKIDLSLFHDKNIKHVFTHSDTLFNKSKAINRGVDVCKNNIIVMNDVDILIPKNYFNCFYGLNRNFGFFFFGKDIYYADLKNTNIVFNGDKWSNHSDRYPFIGGNIAFTKRAFMSIGGMCEQFVGYGSEDGEFWTRIKKLGRGLLYEKRELPLIHLNHEYIKENQVNVGQNGCLQRKLQSMPMSQRIRVIASKLKVEIDRSQ